MRMMMPRVGGVSAHAVAGLFMVGAGPAMAQVPINVLAHPAATFDSGFTRIAGVRELADGRVLVIDPDETSVVLLDLALSRERPIGRRGAGPGEYQLPARVFALSGDSSAVLDRATMKLLVVTPDGRMGGMLDARWDQECHVDGAARLQAPKGIDSEGRYYAEAEPVRIVGGTVRPADSAAIERWSLHCLRDTLAFVPNPFGPGSRVIGGLLIGDPTKRTEPFSPRTEWAVARDGRIAIIRPDPYRVDFIDSRGRRQDGGAIAYVPVRVTESVKKQWREERLRPRYIDMTIRSGASTRSVMKMPYSEPAAWPSFLPPFQADAAMFAPDGRLWVARTTNVGEPPFYDVIDELGRVAKYVRLQPRSRVVGFGRDVVYVARRNDDDLEYLERYTLPP